MDDEVSIYFTMFFSVTEISSEGLVWLIIGLILAAIVATLFRRKLRPTAPDSPILLAHTFTGQGVMASTSGATPAGFYFQYIVSISTENEHARGVYLVELPFHSGVHLLGIPKLGEGLDVVTDGGAMEPVVLEGDYPNYFSLYADIGDQTDSRFILDPKAMSFTVDFCRNYSWEIVGDSLYFSSDTTAVPFDIIDQFVQEIRPAIEITSDRKSQPQMTMSYTNFDGRELDCPICSKILVTEHDWLSCPNGHGVLVTAAQLRRLRDIGDSDDDNSRMSLNVKASGGSPVGHGELTCPYCQHTMRVTTFGTTNIQTNVCSSCMFRWLDAGEAVQLFIS